LTSKNVFDDMCRMGLYTSVQCVLLENTLGYTAHHHGRD